MENLLTVLLYNDNADTYDDKILCVHSIRQWFKTLIGIYICKANVSKKREKKVEYIRGLVLPDL